MSKQNFYLINAIEVQVCLDPYVKHNYEQLITHKIPKIVFEDLLVTVNDRAESPRNTLDLISGLVLWSINSGHVVAEKYLTVAYETLSNNLMEFSGYEDTSDRQLGEMWRLKVEVLKEELGIIKYVLDTKQPYPDKMPLDLEFFSRRINPENEAPRFLPNMRIQLVDTRVNSSEGTQVRITTKKNRISLTGDRDE